MHYFVFVKTMQFTFLINDCLLNWNWFCYIKYDFWIMWIITVAVACVPFVILYLTQIAEKKRERAKKCEEILIRINNLQAKISDFMEKWFGRDDLFRNQYLVAQTFEDIEVFKKDFFEIQNYYFETDNILTVQIDLYMPNISNDYREFLDRFSKIHSHIKYYLIDIKRLNPYHKNLMESYLENKKEEDNDYKR